MSTRVRQAFQSAAGAAGGGGLDVDEVFSTYLYTGNGGAQTITNGVDLDGEGGLVWTKPRDLALGHILYDSERSGKLSTNETTGEGADSFSFSMNSSGYSFNTGSSAFNQTGNYYVSWTWRKAPKFFDVVTYTGNGTQGRTVSHNLGSAPGFLVVKKTSPTGNWPVYHRGMTSALYGMQLNTNNDEFDADSYWDSTDPTDSVFTLGNNADVNQSGATYVAYLFAHNNNDGEFGPDSDQDIIKCGSYTGAGSSGVSIDLGFEPQWLLIKKTNGASFWVLYDTMRGLPVSGDGQLLKPSATTAEAAGQAINVTSTGFDIFDGNDQVNGSGDSYIYIAIRRGPMAVPESATDVFAMDVSNGSGPPYFTSGFPVDFAFKRRTDIGDAWDTSARLMGDKYIELNSFVDQETLSLFEWDYQNGWFGYSGNNTQSWMWKRAPGYFDTVSYIADGVQGSAFNHNLGVVPEMMWIKKLTANQNWYVYHKDIGNDKYLSLNTNLVPTSNTLYLNSTTPDDTTFTVGNVANNAPQRYINMLFATVPGVSKVGSYTGNGSSSRTIDCGFSNGARFFFIKDTTQAGPWWTFDTERGLGFYMDLSSADTKSEAASLVSANSSGFAVTLSFNFSNRTYIFYAVA
jgi:hypothetical protein